jgi:hypothetical protein
MATNRCEDKAAQRRYMKDYDKCELCGSKKNLQLHHIIPLVTSIVGLNLDVQDNYICVCSSCHAKLTPKNLITKYGMSRKRFLTEKRRLEYYFYKNIGDKQEKEEYPLSACDIMDIFDETIGTFEFETA